MSTEWRCTNCGDHSPYVDALRAELVAAQAREAALREALSLYSPHRLSLMTNEAANVVRSTVGPDLLTEGQLLARFDMLREYVCRTVPPMLDVLRKIGAVLAAPSDHVYSEREQATSG